MGINMKRYGKSMVNLLLAILGVLALVLVVPKVLVFFAPFVVGWIIAAIAGPPVRFFEEKLKLKRKIGSAFVIVLVIGLVVLLLYFAGYLLVTQAIGWIGSWPELWKNLEQDIAGIGRTLERYLSKLPFGIRFNLNAEAQQIGTYLTDFFGKIGTPTIEAAGNIAKSIPNIFLGVVMALLSSYFFVADRKEINAWCAKNMPKGLQEQYFKIRNILLHSVGGYFKAQFKIEIWIYVLIALGLGILGVDYFLLIALGIAVLDFLPVFGSGAVLLPWAVIRFFTADYKMAIGLLITWGVGQLVRQLIQPKIVGDSVGIAPLPTLVLLFAGYKVSGVIGMIIAVPVGIVLDTMYKEGAFDTIKDSIRILLKGLNDYRRITPEDKADLEEKQEESSAKENTEQ